MSSGTKDNFNPDQPRDEHGRWTDGGAGPSAADHPSETLLAAQADQSAFQENCSPAGGKAWIGWRGAPDRTRWKSAEALAFCVVDGAALPGLVQALDGFETPWCCLFAGAFTEAMKRTAPYLVALPEGSAAARWWAKTLNGGALGIGVGGVAGVDFAELRRHCRSLLLVQMPDHRRVLFRWYDPRVLAAVLPLLNYGQRDRLFGPITRLDFRSAHGGGVDHAEPPAKDGENPSATGPLVIAAEQLASLDAAAERRFRAWLDGWLRASLLNATKDLDHAALAQRIADGLALARSYGVAGRRALAQFMAVDLLLGAGFFDLPVVHDFLATPDVSADDKPGMILQALVAPPPEKIVRFVQVIVGFAAALSALGIVALQNPTTKAQIEKAIAGSPSISNQEPSCVGGCQKDGTANNEGTNSQNQPASNDTSGQSAQPDPEDEETKKRRELYAKRRGAIEQFKQENA